jgi:hypothetical protein
MSLIIIIIYKLNNAIDNFFVFDNGYKEDTHIP